MNVIESMKKLHKSTLLFLGFGLFFMISALSEFLPGFNGPVGMLLISAGLLYVGIRNARRDLVANS